MAPMPGRRSDVVAVNDKKWGYKGNADQCPHGCGLTYKKLRTGLQYDDVYELLKDHSEDKNDWTYKRRHTVLGKWFEIKQSMWDEHCNEGGCLMDPRNIAADEVPF